MALLHDGTLYSWGFGEQGRLGLGDELTRTRPVMLDPLPHNMLPVRIQCGYLLKDMFCFETGPQQSFPRFFWIFWSFHGLS